MSTTAEIIPIDRGNNTLADKSAAVTAALGAENSALRLYTSLANDLHGMRRRSHVFGGIAAGTRDQLVKFGMLKKVSARRLQARAVVAAEEAVLGKTLARIKQGDEHAALIPIAKIQNAEAERAYRNGVRANMNAMILGNIKLVRPKGMFTAPLGKNKL